MSQYFAWDYTGAPFQLFGPAHIAALLALVLIGYGLMQFKKADEATRRKVGIALGVFLWVNESAWHLWNIYWGHWNIQTLLPLNACSLLIWLCGFMFIFKNYTIYEFAYFMGMGGAIQYLLTPDLGIYGFPHFRYWQTFLAHGLLFIAPIYMTVVIGFRPTWKSMLRVFIGSNIYMGIVFVINMWIGSDYLFVNGKPATASIMDMLPPWPYYIIYLEVLGILTFLILYIPFIIKDWRERRRVSESA